jgi:hypothetical protein
LADLVAGREVVRLMVGGCLVYRGCVEGCEEVLTGMIEAEKVPAPLSGQVDLPRFAAFEGDAELDAVIADDLGQVGDEPVEAEDGR